MRRRSGFTLVELLVVVLVIGILAAIALPRFLGQRTRAKNAAAQAAARHALVAARSYYTQNGESYAGLGPSELKGYESSLSGTEPADGQQPGASGANPQDIWIGNGVGSTNPVAGDANAGKTVTLCSVSRGDTVYCARDANGTAGYYAFQGGAVLAGADASLYTASGWASPGPLTAAVESGGTLLDDGFNSGFGDLASPTWSVYFGSGSGGSATYDANSQGYAPFTGVLSAKAAKLVTPSDLTANTLVRTGAALSSLTSDTAEIRWWMTTNASSRSGYLVYDNNQPNGTFYIDYSDGGVLRIYCDRTNPANTTGYGTAGFHTVGSWSPNTQYQGRVVLNFTNKTYTLWMRSNLGAAWTQYYKAGAGRDLPMRSGSVTAMGVLGLGTNSATSANTVAYFDEVQYSNTGIGGS